LGAESGALLRRALLGVGALAGVGVIAGLGATVAVSRWLTAYLFEVSAVDPRSLAVAAGLLLTTALVAGLGPAVRASRVDPVQVLRAD
jgi:ABC-type lipoprotein release transport system permease subunit